MPVTKRDMQLRLQARADRKIDLILFFFWFPKNYQIEMTLFCFSGMFIALDDQEHYPDHTTIVPGQRYSTIKLAIALIHLRTHAQLDYDAEYFRISYLYSKQQIHTLQLHTFELLFICIFVTSWAMFEQTARNEKSILTKCTIFAWTRYEPNFMLFLIPARCVCVWFNWRQPARYLN